MFVVYVVHVSALRGLVVRGMSALSCKYDPHGTNCPSPCDSRRITLIAAYDFQSFLFSVTLVTVIQVIPEI